MTGADTEPQSNGGDTAPTEVSTDNAPSSMEQDVIRQIEYYFGDINLPRDKFLQEQLKLDDGWVPLDVLTKFHRLAKLTSDTDVIATSLSKATSGLMELSEDQKKVRRSLEHPLPELNEERRKELTSKTLYVKGFPHDATVDVCLKFFEDHPTVENVLMRRYQDRETKKWNFKGSVFATFKTRDQAEKFLSTTGLKYGETELVVRWQEDYLKEKHEEYQTRKEKKTNKEGKKDKKEEKPEEKIQLPGGSVLHFTDIGDTISREQIKEALTKAGGEVAFIDFNKCDKEGWVRLSTENSAKPFFEKLTEGKLKVEESELVFKVLEGDEEKAFLDKTVQEMMNRRKNIKHNKFNKGGRHHGRNQGGRKRKQEVHADAPAQKVKA